MNDVLKLQADVTALATAEGRKVGTPGHDAAKSYLLERLDSLNLQPYQGDFMELSYKSGGNTFSNLVAVLPGKDQSLKPILVGAHYDSVISS
jgi:acetylornithine deacetylase/succinyl-diaminopimelate desuccinylase-like protein